MVPIVVVNALEQVNVHQQHRKGPGVAKIALILDVQLLKRFAAIGQAGQGIVLGGILEFRGQLQQPQLAASTALVKDVTGDHFKTQHRYHGDSETGAVRRIEQEIPQWAEKEDDGGEPATAGEHPNPGFADVENDGRVGKQPDNGGTVLYRVDSQVGEQHRNQGYEAATLQGLVTEEQVAHRVDGKKNGEANQ